jgi:diguanylate cyclase (GGDEF)-like protein
VQLVVTALRDSDECITGYVGISYDLTERKRADEYIYHVAHHDPLTGLPTRTLLRDRLEVAIERGRRSQDTLAVMMVDLDNFKRVNDSLGHQAGDTVLCEISKRLQACVRKSDTVGRMGGDEFVVLLPDLRSDKDADEISQKLLATVAQPIRIGKHEIIVTASIGISFFPGCDDVDSLFKNADFAMYRVKNSGRNGSQVYTPGIGMQGLQQLQMESAMRNALEAHEFEILYQPQIAFADGRILGVESLLRWNSTEFGLVGPNTFIPLAEETGLIVPIGEWVLLESCKEIANLQRRLGIEFSVAVNISPRQFQQKDFPATVEHALQTSGLKPEQLELEITEHLLMVDSEESLEIMRRVRKLGVRFAIDDFGTGFSNMGYITRFAVDRIKIDRSFISRCDVDENSRAVTAAVIALAHSLQIEVIAEGVESEQHVQMLRQMSCDQAQGYFYSRPLKLADMQNFSLRNLLEYPHRRNAIPPHRESNRLALSALSSIA